MLKSAGDLSERVQPGTSAAASDTDPCKLEKFCSYEEPFKQPAANRIDDASHRGVGAKPNVQIGLARKKPVAAPVCLSPESRGFGLHDNK